MAGLFQMNWVQLFALNPTHISPEAAVKNVIQSVACGMLGYLGWLTWKVPVFAA